MLATVRLAPLWRAETFTRKLTSLLSLRWSPSDEALEKAARETFLEEVFGADDDFGPQFFRLLIWHSSRAWNLSSLTEHDIKRAEALETFTVLTRRRLRKSSSSPLSLRLAARNLLIPLTAMPMVAKIPVISLKNYLEVHSTFSFSAIRRSNHKHSDSLISLLYEILFLQQKIAIALDEFARLVTFAFHQKKEAALINAEATAIINADVIFAYLKSSFEKTISLVGLGYSKPNLDNHKTHKARYNALLELIPLKAKSTHYGAFFLENLSSENLEELNKYRSGLLHKRGIADLQPHNYVSPKSGEIPFQKIFAVLHEHHAKNTAVLLCGLALLVDELVELDPPDFPPEELHKLFALEEIESWFKNFGNTSD